MLIALLLPSAAFTGCASGGDAVSRELVSITHRVTTNGALGVSDDGGYEFIDSSEKRATKGQLSRSELEELEAHLAEPRLAVLYGFRSTDDNACSVAVDGYIIKSRAGTSCFVSSEVTDNAARADLDYFIGLYREKSAAK